jgi:putative nucleotidyltransferase with HDIG domain
MLRLSIDCLEPGMVLAKSVTDERGNILLRQGVSLTSDYISNLKRRGFPSAYICDGDTDDIVAEDDISDEARRAALTTLSRVFDFTKQISADFATASSDAIIACMQDSGVKNALRGDGVFEQLELVVTSIIDEMMSTDALAGMAQIRSHDDITYSHSIDVTVAAIMVGRRLYFNRRDLERLATGCMLHDIGKVYINQEILKKRTSLTSAEASRMQEHARLGYELLRLRNPDAAMSNHVALEHHERQDGRGYPRHLHGFNTIRRSQHDPKSILLISEIAAVADVYDILSVEKPGKPGLPPQQIANTMRRMAGTILNKEVTEHFLSTLPLFPVGIDIVVRTGTYADYKGVVVQTNKSFPDRPVVRILYNPQGERIVPIDINLERQNSIIVEATLRQ